MPRPAARGDGPLSSAVGSLERPVMRSPGMIILRFKPSSLSSQRGSPPHTASPDRTLTAQTGACSMNSSSRFSLSRNAIAACFRSVMSWTVPLRVSGFPSGVDFNRPRVCTQRTVPSVWRTMRYSLSNECSRQGNTFEALRHRGAIVGMDQGPDPLKRAAIFRVDSQQRFQLGRKRPSHRGNFQE